MQKISEAEFRQLLRLFCLEMEAAKIAEFMGINCVTVNRILSKIRELKNTCFLVY